MSYLSEEIKRQISSANISQLDVSAKSGISQGQISKWINREQTSISAEQIDAIATALSKDRMDHARLLVAHLQDERFGAAKDLVAVDLKSEFELVDRPYSRTKGEKALHFLAEQRVKYKSVDDLIIDLAKCQLVPTSNPQKTTESSPVVWTLHDRTVQTRPVRL